MSRFRVSFTIVLGIAAGSATFGQVIEGVQGGVVSGVPAPEGFFPQHAGRRDDDRAYTRGQSALDARRWDEAVAAFSEAAADNGSRADGALYWKAYALNKLGRREEALSSIAQLRQKYSSSRWLDDAKALEMEVRQKSGQKVNPNAEPDDDLKLMALNGLMNSDPERALPLLEKFLQGNQSPKLKERALFVLAQSDSAKGRQILAQIARGGSNPDLQMKAINYLGVMGSQENRKLLSDIYSSSNDSGVKRAVLHSFMVSGDREHLLQAAKSEKNPELRMESIHQLGISGGQNELWQLYQAEPSLDVKEQILHSMFVGGNSDKLLDVARNEKNPKLRKAAIHSLGLMGGEHTGTALVSMYSSESDPSLRGEIVNALFIQGNAKAMVELARKETNPETKKMIVGKLSIMGSKDSTDYMMELLNK
ncbi:MAG: HEAT repeat domain-containing protein [Bryobacteraceae bacterium]